MRKTTITIVLAALAAAPALAQDSAWTLLDKGIKAFQKKNYERATVILKAAVRADGSCHDAYYYLGRIAEKQRQHKVAADYYGKISSEWPTYSLAAERLGHMAMRSGDLKRAATHFATHAKARPSTTAWLQLGTVQLDLEQYKEAEATLKEAGKHSKGNLELAEMLGRLYLETNRHKEALDQYTAIVKKIPIDNTARYLRGVCLENLKRDSEAQKEWTEVVKRDPFNGLALKALIRAYEGDPGKKAEVVEYERRLEMLAKSKPRVRPVSGN